MSNVYRDFQHWKKTDDFKKWRHKQFLIQGGLCWYCQIYLNYTRQNVEHKTARSLGGRNNKSNLVLSCSTCNKEKGSKSLSHEERERLNKLNKPNKNTYQKNKQYHYNQYGVYSDEAFYTMIKDF